MATEITQRSLTDRSLIAQRSLTESLASRSPASRHQHQHQHQSEEGRLTRRGTEREPSRVAHRPAIAQRRHGTAAGQPTARSPAPRVLSWRSARAQLRRPPGGAATPTSAGRFDGHGDGVIPRGNWSEEGGERLRSPANLCGRRFLREESRSDFRGETAYGRRPHVTPLEREPHVAGEAFASLDIPSSPASPAPRAELPEQPALEAAPQLALDQERSR